MHDRFNHLRHKPICLATQYFRNVNQRAIGPNHDSKLGGKEFQYVLFASRFNLMTPSVLCLDVNTYLHTCTVFKKCTTHDD